MSIHHYCSSRVWLGVLAFTISLLAFRPLSAEETQLTNRQAGLASRYQQLEELLLRLAEVEAAENPERSALLRRAARQSRDKFVLERMRNASEALRTEEFQKAVDDQAAAVAELEALLQLLLSEDRSKRIRDEKERLSKVAKEIKRALRAQQSTRARTENGADLDELESEQQSIGDRTEKIADQLAEDNEDAFGPDASELDPSQPSSETERGERQDQDRPDRESTPGEPSAAGEPSEAEQKAGESQEDEQESESSESDQQPQDEEPNGQEPSDQETQSPADSQSPSESQSPLDSSQSPEGQQQGQPQQGQPQQGQPQQGQPQQGQPQQGQPQQGQPQGDQQQSPQTPEQQVEQQLREALQRMREAEQQLDKSKREQATKEQREAEEKLRAAVDRLERILRQLREEEMQRELARLESRLRKMAAMQSQVLDDTVALAATPAVQRNRQTDMKAGELSLEQKKITLEADRAMLLLREEGSSVAFPEVISQISGDSKQVAEFLAETKVDEVTQGIQNDILAALEEMIAATQQAQRDLEEQKRQQQEGQPQQGGPQEQPLVQQIAELKLIRTMETRIKSTTERYAGMIESSQQDTGDLLPLLQDLSERQNRLYRITRDLVLQRNQ